jgi:cytochrome b561
MTDQARYAGIALFYHWVMAVLVGSSAFLGLLHDSWPHATQAKWTHAHALTASM